MLLSIWPDAAQALGIGRTKMFELIGRGDIATVAIDGRRLVSVDELRSFVDRRGTSGATSIRSRVRESQPTS